MRRLFCRCLLWLLIFSWGVSLVPHGSAEALQPELASEAAILMDAETGQILFDKNAYLVMYPASITKVLTGLLALEHGNPEQEFTVSDQVIAQVPRSSSHIALQPGEKITLGDALYALAISSANDAAVAIAEEISGSVEAFAELMNQEASQLGTMNSHFVNPNGLPSGEHYTTAYDMALITARAIKEPDFLRYFGSGAYVIPATNLSGPRNLTAKNQFIDGQRICQGLLFSKTGWTTAAQGTLVSAARRDGTTLIAVTLKSPMLDDKYIDTQKLFDYGFEEFHRFTVDEAYVLEQLSKENLTDVVLENFEPFSILIPRELRDEDVRLVIPGGFDPSSGVATIPISVVARNKAGEYFLLREELLDVSVTNTSNAEPEELMAAVTGQPHTLGWIPLALVGLVVLGLLAMAVKKNKKQETLNQSSAAKR